MDPIRAVVRGVKISSSNLALAVLSWAVGVATVLLLVVPLVLLVGGTALWLARSVDAEASGTEALFVAVSILLEHWPLTFGVLLLATVWAGAVLFAYLYAQAGILGCVVESHRRGAAEDQSLKPRLGAAPTFAVFDGGAFWAQVKAHGGRVTAVATAYSLVATAPLLLDGAWTWWCVKLALGGGMGLVLGVAGGVAGLALLVLVLTLLAIHYRFALVCAVLRSCGWREAVGAANVVFRTRPLAALAVVGFTYAARYALGLITFIVTIPLAVFSFLPVVGLLFLMPRLLLSVVQGLVSGGITVASLGATAAVCEPVREEGTGEWEKGRQGGTGTGWGVLSETVIPRLPATRSLLPSSFQIPRASEAMPRGGGSRRPSGRSRRWRRGGPSGRRPGRGGPSARCP